VSRRARFQPEASSELREAARWYEARRPGFGLAFLAAVDDAIEMVVTWPNSGAPVAGAVDDLIVRRARVHGFPYHVGYLHADDEILVLAIAHNRRRPGYWTSRR
jgi:plasmid stabilization system protein ParE